MLFRSFGIIVLLLATSSSISRADIDGIQNVDSRVYHLYKRSPKSAWWCEEVITPTIDQGADKTKRLVLTARVITMLENHESSFGPPTTECPETATNLIEVKDHVTTITFEVHNQSCKKGVPSDSSREVWSLRGGKEIEINNQALVRSASGTWVADRKDPGWTCIWR